MSDLLLLLLENLRSGKITIDYTLTTILDLIEKERATAHLQGVLDRLHEELRQLEEER